MQSTPTILLVADEPMFIVDMLLELESRGFAIVPMRPDGDRASVRSDAYDAAVLDLHGRYALPQTIALNLRRQAIPVVVLDGGNATHSARFLDGAIRLSQPVDYDRLADLLWELVSRSPSRDAPDRGAGVHEHRADGGGLFRMASQ